MDIPAWQRLIWNQGLRSYMHTTVGDLGSMGVGMYLYFWVVRIMAFFFVFCAILAIPAMILHREVRMCLAPGVSSKQRDHDRRHAGRAMTTQYVCIFREGRTLFCRYCLFTRTGIRMEMVGPLFRRIA